MDAAFITDDFLLESDEARTLYHSVAQPLPIIDYHNHLPPKDIAENTRFKNLWELWLSGDHYKWRAMRANGVDERFITGEGSPWEKFEKWAETVPKTLRNPLYHWTHLELRRPFGISDRLLGPHSARDIWDACNEKLSDPAFSARGILRQMNVEMVCTTDDPVENLEWHAKIARDPSAGIAVFPAFRADRALVPGTPATFAVFLKELSAAADTDITSYDRFIIALRSRHDFFHDRGCRLSDHGLESLVTERITRRELNAIFAKLSRGKEVPGPAIARFRSAVLHELAVMDWEKGWVQQFHLGALRNANSRMLRTIGPDSGSDSIGDFPQARPLARFLDNLDRENKLAKTILYNLNPGDNEIFASMIGNFQDGSTPGKMQVGPAWWFLDQIDGMTRQIDALSTMGLLSQFVGMVTDSRSFLSFSRHEYFRRLLCNILGTEMRRGLLPRDLTGASELVRDVCYFNAKRYFPFSRPAKEPPVKPPAKPPRAAKGKPG